MDFKRLFHKSPKVGKFYLLTSRRHNDKSYFDELFSVLIRMSSEGTKYDISKRKSFFKINGVIITDITKEMNDSMIHFTSMKSELGKKIMVDKGWEKVTNPTIGEE